MKLSFARQNIILNIFNNKIYTDVYIIKEDNVMFNCKGGFFKGLITGAVMSSAVCMMTEPSSAVMMRKMRRKANRAMKSIGSMVDDIMGN